MTQTARHLLWVVTGLTLLAAGVLWDVLGTVFIAITVAIVAGPLYEWLDRQLQYHYPWWAAVLTTLVVFLLGIVLFVPFAIVLYQRRNDIVEFLSTLPETIVIGAGGFEFALETSRALDSVAESLTAIAVGLVRAAPELALKLMLFTIVLFALLLHQRKVARTLFSAVPTAYQDTALAMADRLRSTLVVLYVLQAVTAVGTFFIALPVFWLLGYDVPVVLALLAGLLQFLPIVGPSLLVGGMVVFELIVGTLWDAVVVAVVAGVLVVLLPDVTIRPKLASRSAKLPGSLYFIGFTGGLLTIGPIGVIAGPVVVALLLEAFNLLAADADVSVDRTGPPAGVSDRSDVPDTSPEESLAE